MASIWSRLQLGNITIAMDKNMDYHFSMFSIEIFIIF